MDKAEYRIKLEQINSLAEAGDFAGAASVADSIDWRHVKSVRTLCMVGEIYEANKRYEDSKRVLLYAYKRSSISKTVLYRLAEINIRTGDIDAAKRYYNEFEQLSPHDTSRYILKYKLLRAEGAPLDDQIAVLRDYKEREYTERWAYELAKLYMKNGQKQKCIDECDEMILWFAEGKYVTRAMELKMQIGTLSNEEKTKYNSRLAIAEKEKAEELREEASMTGEEMASKAADRAMEDEEKPGEEKEKEKRKVSTADMIRKMEAAAAGMVAEQVEGSGADIAAADTDEDVREVSAEDVEEVIKAIVDGTVEEAMTEAAETGSPDETAKEADSEKEREAKAEAAGADEAESTDHRAWAGTETDRFGTFLTEKKEDSESEDFDGTGPEPLEEADGRDSEETGSEDSDGTDSDESAAKQDESEEADSERAKRQSGEEADSDEAREAPEKDSDSEEAEGQPVAEADSGQAEGLPGAEADSEQADEQPEEEADSEEPERQSEEEAGSEQAEGQPGEEADSEQAEEESEKETDSEEAKGQSQEEADSEETGEDEEAPEVPVLTPEEIAKNADEEAERALKEMMASFLTEFAESGDEYRLTTEVIPEEEEAAFREETRKKDRERMLGKETDESLGLTRTESFQEQLKKALEADGNYEEANQIIVDSDQFESPEEAARRTVMEANGLEYVLPEDAANLTEAGDGTDICESLHDGAEDFEEADGADSDPAASEGDGSDDVRTGAFAQKALKEGKELTGSESGDADEEGTVTDEEETGIDGASSVDEEDAESADEAGESAEDGESDNEEAEDAAESDVDIVEKILAEPDIMERVEIIPRKLTEEERELFSYFANIPGISEQVSLALADIHNNAGDKTSRSGNVLIMGRQLSGKTRLADGLIRAACLDLHIKAVKVAKVIGEDLNSKDAAEVVDQMSGGFLLIEGAGSMGDEFVEGLNKAMEFRTDDLIVILEDEKADMIAMLERHPEFAKKFTSTVIVPVFTNDELVTFARTYANEQGYRIDEMGTLALYTMIGENQKDDEPMVVGKVKKMVDRAIEHARGPKIASFFRKNASADTGRNWLREKDFR